MRTAGIVIAGWLAVDLLFVAVMAAFGAWRTHQTRSRARGLLVEDREVAWLEDLFALPPVDPSARWIP